MAGGARGDRVTGSILEALRASAGEAASLGIDGLPRVAPTSVETVAAVMRQAFERRWRVRVEGRGSWMPPDAPADLAITTERLDRVVSVAPADLVASVQSGVSLRGLRSALAQHRAWIPIDPPGSSDRTLGSVLATGTAGPLRHRFGPIRDQVLGTTVVTGDGQVVRSGGVVVKNVAGFDLTKIQIGGFAAFGIIVELNLRLRARPAARATLVARGALEPLLEAARAIAEANADLSLLELCSPALTASSSWSLLTQAVGTAEGVSAAIDRVVGVTGDLTFDRLDSDPADRLLAAIGEAMLESPVVARAGVLAPGTPDVVDLIGETIGHGRLSASLGAGGLRWAGNPTPAHLRALRVRLAEREIPVTLERAPWTIRREVGHFGAFREGVRPLTERVRAVFDPAQLLAAPLEVHDGA
jgi:glycolate oxidase FAD binding subunit